MRKEITNYLEELKKIRQFSENTISSYENDLNEYFNYLEENHLNYLNMSYEDARTYLSYLYKKEDKARTVSRKISSLRGFYAYLKANDKVSNNPFKLVKMPKKEKNLPRFFYYNELEELFNSIENNTDLGKRNILILEMLYATGVRVSELINIKLIDIDTKRMEIKVKGKGNKERIVFYGEYAKDALEDYLNGAYSNLNIKNSPYLFLNNRGAVLTRRGVTDILNRVIKKTSINKKISPHMLRHTFATHLLNEGCDILAVQELLGHESLTSTTIYTHLTSNHIKEEYLKAHPRDKRN